MPVKHKIYLAARYSRRKELQGYARELEEAGFVVTSRWHKERSRKPSRPTWPLEDRRRVALEDFSDVLDADTVIAFTEPEDAPSSRGGRHVEFGIALQARKVCVVIGPRENVFHCLPSVIVCETWKDFLRWFLDSGEDGDAS